MNDREILCGLPCPCGCELRGMIRLEPFIYACRDTHKRFRFTLTSDGIAMIPVLDWLLGEFTRLMEEPPIRTRKDALPIAERPIERHPDHAPRLTLVHDCTLEARR